MIQLQIPTQDQEAVKCLLSIPTQRLIEYASALDGATVVGVVRLARQVLGENSSEAVRLLLMLVNIRRRNNVTAAHVVAGVRDAIKRTPLSDSLPLYEERSSVLERLVGHRALFLFEKTAELASSSANTFVDARIVTDVRPVFDDDTKKAEVSIVTHTLRFNIASERGDADDAIFVSMTKSDLVNLAEQIQRALEKIEVIRSSIGPTMPMGLIISSFDDEVSGDES